MNSVVDEVQPINFNTNLDYKFEILFNRLFTSSNLAERRFLTLHKYCLRKKYVASYRVDGKLTSLRRIAYFLFRKMDSYGMLTFKIFLNIVGYFILLPMLSFFRTSYSATELREVYKLDAGENQGATYYSGSIANFIKNISSISNIVSFKSFCMGLSGSVLPNSEFIDDVTKTFSNSAKSDC